MDEDSEIIQEFLLESYENLDQMDQDLVELEQAPSSRELLSSIFRTIHTIKGTSGFLAFGQLETLTHIGENLLSQLRDGKMTVSRDSTQALLELVDTVRLLLERIEQTGSDAGDSNSIDAAVSTIRTVLDGEPLPTVAAAPEPPADVAADVKVAEVAEVEVEAGEETGAEDAPAAQAPAEDDIIGDLDDAGTDEEADELDDEPGDTTDASAAAPVDQLVPAPLGAELVVGEPAGAEPAAEGTGDGEHHDKRAVVDSSVRVDIDLLDLLVQQVGELVLTRNQIMQRLGPDSDADLVRAAQRLDMVASELQEGIMRTRMQPIGHMWAKMPRIVRDLSRQLDRRVNLVMEGHETELDRSLLETLKAPLTHLVRNSLDHGIEPPEKRVALGKPAEGTLTLRANHESGQVVIEIIDDGAGMDPARIAAVAMERGILTRDQVALMDQREIINLIFRPGFSTAAKVTNVSGRGVGMDVVRTNIEGIGGTVDVTSEFGKGTVTRVRIPLTLAIIPALVVGQSDERYAVPLANLVELVRIEADSPEVEHIAGDPVLRLRGQLLPLVSLASVLGQPTPTSQVAAVVVVQNDNTRFGLIVDQVHDTQEIVVKPLGKLLKSLPVYTGVTIMGDGRIAMILDIAGLAESAAVGTVAKEAMKTSAADQGVVQSLLVMEIAGGRRAALPLTDIARLEEFENEAVEFTGHREVVQYRGGILPLVRLAPALQLSDTSQSDPVSVVVHERDEHRLGVVIDRVLDIVETTLEVDESGRRPGVYGTAIVQGKVTDLVDLNEIVASGALG